ncbi:MAG: DUF2190 family protein [Nitrososphaerales archaeon]
MADSWPDADLGDLISPRSESVVFSFKAGAGISKGDPVYLSGADEVSPATSAQNCIGVAIESASAGEYVAVCLMGVVKVRAGGAISRGQAVYAGDSSKRILALDDQAVNEGGTATYTIYYSRRLGFALDSFAAADDLGRILVVK